MIQNNQFKQDQEQIEKDKKKILFEINKTNNEIKIEKNKKIWFIISTILVMVLFIRIVFGTIDIPNIFGYPSNKSRFYKVTLNDELISTEYYLIQKIPVIPHLIYLKSEYFDSFITKGDIDAIRYNGDDLDKFIIDVESYSCHYKKSQTKCKNENSEMQKNNDTTYNKLEIWRTTKPHEQIYNGEFINDITPYIKDNGKGIYVVTIYAEYEFIETKIVFDIDIGIK